MTWAIAGLVLSLFAAAFAAVRSRRPTANYYETHVYGITSGTHRGYAAVSLVFAIFFAASLALRRLPVVPVLALYVLVFIFYFSSFARGFSDEE